MPFEIEGLRTSLGDIDEDNGRSRKGFKRIIYPSDGSMIYISE